jgi:hypothetical protein
MPKAASPAYEKMNEHPDKLVEDVIPLKADTDVSQWMLGQKISQIFKTKAWMARQDPETGKPKYRSFNQFCAEELDLSAAYSYQLMDVASTFTEEQVRAIGASKIRPILRLPEAKRPELIARILRENLSKAQIQQEIEKLSTAHRTPNRSERRRPVKRTRERSPRRPNKCGDSRKACRLIHSIACDSQCIHA